MRICVSRFNAIARKRPESSSDEPRTCFLGISSGLFLYFSIFLLSSIVVRDDLGPVIRLMDVFVGQTLRFVGEARQGLT
jgi:hypothetical protein